ncbi:MAG: hypothetical protein RL091_1733 [Verrucomicrobiota bacterium]|jgi:LacI family transcriptional regulator/LacI family repressor for deo operon, udp, cdd, tsx, nupC, and nupG
MQKRVTQKSIAANLKLHPSTVCLALKNSPLIPEATKSQVQAAAQRLGYVRDPVLAALSAYARRGRGHGFHGTIAWLVSTADGENWRERPEYLAYHAGAKARAQQLGYVLDIFDLHPHENSPDRLLRIFRRRNIRGVLVCPQPKGDTVIKMDCGELSAVTFGYTVTSPRLHAVTAYHFAAIREIFARLRKAGYKRIGCAIPEIHDNRLRNAYSAGYLVEQKATPPKCRVPPFTYTMRAADSFEQFSDWLIETKPDALITVHYNAPDFLKRLKLAIPAHLGVALTSIVDGVRHYAGIDEDSEGIGRVAAELLVSMVERGEVGLPQNPQRVLYSGSWQDGTTIRQ